MTSGAVSGDDTAYLRWHLLDHLPEQYSIPGIRLGTRWRADDECVAMRLTATDDLAPVRHVVSYLMAEPAAQTLTAFARLGRRLAEEGRYPEPATPHLLGAFERHRAYAAPSARVSADAVPFRPHRGVYLVVERFAAEASVDGWWRWHHRGPRPGPPRDRGGCRRVRRSGAARSSARELIRARASGRPRRGTRRAATSRSCTSTATSRRRRPAWRRSCDAAGRTTASSPGSLGPSAAPWPTRPGQPGPSLSRCASAWSALTR